MELEDFEKHKDHMDYETILTFAKYGFICKQILNKTFEELQK